MECGVGLFKTLISDRVRGWGEAGERGRGVGGGGGGAGGTDVMLDMCVYL